MIAKDEGFDLAWDSFAKLLNLGDRQNTRQNHAFHAKIFAIILDGFGA
jgi:hypothetical protein